MDPHVFDQRTAHVLTDWQPTERIFAPTNKTLDPRLFDPNTKQMLAGVRAALLMKMSHFMEDHGTPSWMDYARVYLAGSEASLWWGNNDFDVLVGIDYDAFRAATGSTMSDLEITESFNDAFKVDWNDEEWVAPWGGVWHLTGYVNPQSYDIRKIKPYAAYEVVSGTWFVEPPEEPTAHQFDQSFWYLAEGYAEQIKAYDELPEPKRTQQLQALWHFLHSDRSRAFGPNGTGVFDRGNAVMKYLEQEPVEGGPTLWDLLVKAQYGNAAVLGSVALPYEAVYQVRDGEAADRVRGDSTAVQTVSQQDAGTARPGAEHQQHAASVRSMPAGEAQQRVRAEVLVPPVHESVRQREGASTLRAGAATAQRSSEGLVPQEDLRHDSRAVRGTTSAAGPSVRDLRSDPRSLRSGESVRGPQPRHGSTEGAVVRPMQPLGEGPGGRSGVRGEGLDLREAARDLSRASKFTSAWRAQAAAGRAHS